MLCCNMLCKHVKIKIIASTLFGGSGGAIYMRKVLARAGVHIILARIVHCILFRVKVMCDQISYLTFIKRILAFT